MALTYRETKGSALTIAELDGNFQYFTGSHPITGSLIVTQAVTASSFSGSFTGSFLGTSSYATQALSASYFSGSMGAATFTEDVNFTSGANVDGLFVVIPLTDTAITGGLQVQRGEASPGDVQYMAINYQGGGGRLVATNKTTNTPSMFIMLQDTSANVNMMEFRTVLNGGVATAYMIMNTAVLPTSEPSISGQLWLSGSAGASSKLLAVRN